VWDLPVVVTEPQDGLEINATLDSSVSPVPVPQFAAPPSALRWEYRARVSSVQI